MVASYDRRLRTSTETRAVTQGYLAVGARFFSIYTQGVLHGFEHLLRAHQMARWAPTDIHRRQSWWRKPEVGVERRHAPNIVDRGIAKYRGLFNSFVWDVVQLVLNCEQ